MNIESREEKGNNQRLLQALMVLLNVGVLIAAALLGWSVYRLITRSTEIFSLLNGNILS